MKISDLKNKLFVQDKWRIGYAKNNNISNISNSEIKWLNFDDVDYEADPFLLKIKDEIYIAYESFNYINGNAKIKCRDLNGNYFDFFSELNEEKGHKSFPYIFYDKNNIYCIPEISDNNCINLYKFNFDGNVFERKHKIDIPPNSYIDSFIYYYNNVYYLFTSTVDEPYKLLLFYSKDLFSTFTLHPHSPISNDISHSRNAGGIISENGFLFRPGQNCEKTYGGSISLMRIDEISENSYKESFYQEISPFSPYFDGLHTLNKLDNHIVIDGKMFVFNFNVFLKKIILKFLIKTKIEIKF